MKIIDICNVIAHITGAMCKESDIEHCALALVEEKANSDDNNSDYYILDYCMAEEFGGSTTSSISFVPRELSIALMTVCKKNHYIPLLIHTHIPSKGPDRCVSFSTKDRIFNKRFCEFAADHGYTSTCLFLVTDGRTIAVYEKTLYREQYVSMEMKDYVENQRRYTLDII